MNIDRDKHNKYVVGWLPSVTPTTNTLSSSLSNITIVYGGGGGGGSATPIEQDAFGYFTVSDGTNTVTLEARVAKDIANLSIIGSDTITVQLVSDPFINELQVTSTGTNLGSYTVSYSKHEELTGTEEEPVTTVTWPLVITYVQGDRLQTSLFDTLTILNNNEQVATYPQSSLAIEGDENGITKISVNTECIRFTNIQLTLTVQEATEDLEAIIERPIIFYIPTLEDTKITLSGSEASAYWKLDELGNLYTEYNAYSTKELSAYGWGGEGTPGGGGASFLRELNDVSLPETIPDNSILQYNSATQAWEAVQAGDLGGSVTLQWVQDYVEGVVSPIEQSIENLLPLLDWFSFVDGKIRANYDFFGIGEVSAYGIGDGQAPQGKSYLRELEDVLITSLSDNQILMYDATALKWVNVSKDEVGLNLTELAQYLTTNNYAKKSDIILNNILDMDGTWKGLLSASPTDYVLRWPTFAEVTDKPTTLAGYGITDAYTKDETDDRYVNITGDTMTGNLMLPTLDASVSVIIGNAKLEFDSANNALKLSNVNTGSVMNFYATGEVSAYGLGDGSTSTGAGYLHELGDVVLTSLSNGQLLQYDATTLKWVNIDKDLVGLNEAELAQYLNNNNYLQDGDITWANLSGKPAIFSTNIANIADLNTGWDSILAAAPTAYVTRWPSFSEVTNKPSTLSGYGITDGVNTVSITGTGNAVTSASISGHTLTLTKDYSFAYTTGTNATGTWGISISGNAATASKWATARTITLNGSVTGSVSIDGSGNVTLTTTYTTSNISALDGRYVNITGDTMTGNLILPTLQANTSIILGSIKLEYDSTNNALKVSNIDSNAVMNLYATGEVAAYGFGSGSAAVGGMLNDLDDVDTSSVLVNLVLGWNGTVWTNMTVLSGGATDLSGLTDLNSSWVSILLNTPSADSIGALSLAAADDRYVNVTGDTMTGDLGIPYTPSTIDGSVPYAGSNFANNIDVTALNNYKTILGTVTMGNNTWYSVISIRHRNGNGDGIDYGMYLRSPLTWAAGNLTWGRQYYGGLQAERTLLDSVNYTDYISLDGKYVKVVGDTMTGTLVSPNICAGITEAEANNYYTPGGKAYWKLAVGYLAKSHGPSILLYRPSTDYQIGIGFCTTSGDGASLALDAGSNDFIITNLKGNVNINNATLFNYNNTWLSPSRIQIGRYDTTLYTDRAVIGVTNGNLHLDSYRGYSIYLNHYQAGNSSSNSVIIDPNGNLGVGITPSYKFQVNGAGYFSGSLTIGTNGLSNGINIGNTTITRNDDSSGLAILNDQGIIRFGDRNWDFNHWAGLRYVHANKYVYIGIADGSVFLANSAQSGGSIITPGISNIFVGNNTTNKVWHAGNDGSGSGLDADLLDGLLSTSYFITNAGSLSSSSLDTYVTRNSGTYNIGYSGYSRTLTVFRGAGSSSAIELMSHYLGQLWCRWCIDSNRYQGGFREFAFTDSNVASATRLLTARTIWGQSFDGTTNITGNMINVASITMAGSLVNNAGAVELYAATPYIDFHYGNSTADYTSRLIANSASNLNCTSSFSASGNITAPSFYASNWFRSTGATGWYSETYGGGWYMSDTTWLRAYNSKSVYTPGIMQAGSGFQTTSNSVLQFITYTNKNLITWEWTSTYGDAVNFLIPGTNNLSIYMKLYSYGGLLLSGSLVATGEVTAYSTSDIRLKTNIHHLSALDIVRRLNVVEYDWNATALLLKADKTVHGYGLIALEIETIIPEVVTHNMYSKGYLGIDYLKLVPFALSAIQEVDDEVTMLKKRVTELEYRLSKYEHIN